MLPFLESLESRTLRSVSLHDGTLTIQGTPHSDRVAIYRSSANGNRLHVKVGATVRAFDLAEVAAIVVKARNGNDRITIDQTNGAVMLPTRIYGEDGNDTILAGAGRDRVIAGKGDDVVEGGNNRDVIYGELGNDALDGGNHADMLDGGAGDDSVRGGRGDDHVIGGTGRDDFNSADSENEEDDIGVDDLLDGEDHDHQHEHEGENDNDNDDDDGDNNDDQSGHQD